MSVTVVPSPTRPEILVAEPSLSKALPGPAPRTGMSLARLVVLCGSLFFYGLRTGELYRTESLRAIIAQEFLRGLRPCSTKRTSLNQ